MWLVEMELSDTEERMAARPAHRERLVALHTSGQVRMAGPLADDSGAVIVFDTSDRAQLDRLLSEDPYFDTPGVRTREIREWLPFVA